MKRLMLIFCPLLFFSCGYFENYFTAHDFEISNKCTEGVSFSINGYGDKVYSLQSNQSINLQLYDSPDFTLIGNPRVYYTTGVSSASFYDMNSYNFEISNYCFYDVVISEKNNLLSETYGAVERIPAAVIDDKSVVAGKKTVVVYKTSSPEFEAYYIDGNGNKFAALPFITFRKTE